MAAILRRNPRILIARHDFSTLSAALEIQTPSAPASATAAAPAPAPAAASRSKTFSRVKAAIRSESDPEKIADLFQSSVNLPRFHADRTLYMLSVRRLSRSRRLDLIERILDHQVSDPAAPKSEGFFIHIMTLYSTAGMVDRVVRTFDHMATIGCRRTEHSLCALLTAFLKNRRFDCVIKSFSRVPIELGISPGVLAHNIFLSALSQKGEVDAARSMLDEMSNKESVKPDIVSYNILLNGYLGKGNETGFEEILKEVSDKGLDGNVITYNCRISKLCRRMESFKAEELLDVMISKGVRPNRVSFNTIIVGFCKEGDVESAMRVFKRMRFTKRMNGRGSRDDLSPNSDTYNMLIDTYNMLIQTLVEKEDFGSALEVCRECLMKKLPPSFELVRGIVDDLMKNSKVGEARDLVERMRKILKGSAVDAWKEFEGTLSLQDATS